MALQTAPGVRFEPVDHSSGRIAALRTDVAGFAGVCERGPLDLPVRAGSWEQFRAAFGSLAPNAFLPWSVKAFFENGGRTCWIVRVAAPATSTTTAGAQAADRSASVVADATAFTAGAVATLTQTASTSTAGAQPPDGASSVVVDASGVTAGSTVTLTQAALRDVRRVQRVDGTTIHWTAPLASAFDLTIPIALATTNRCERLIASVAGAAIGWTRPFGEEYDVARPIGIATGAAAAAGELIDSSSTPSLRVEAASPGAWGNALSVVVSRTSRQATRTAGVQPADGSVSLVESVVGIGAGSVLRVFQGGAVPFHRVVVSIDATRKRIVWDVPLAGLDLTLPVSLESVELTLSVYERSTLREMFEGLTLVAADAQHYAPAAVNGASRLIRLTDLASATPVPISHPDPQSPALDGGHLRLAGGRDGIAALRAEDIAGGLRALERIDEVSFIAVPDVLIERVPAMEVLPDPPPPPPDPCLLDPPPTALFAPPPPPAIREQSAHFDDEAILRVQMAMIEQCERLRDRMALLDSPNFRLTELAEIESWRRRFDSKYAALYCPWVLVLDPQGGRELTRAIPPSGHVAGVWARSDLAVGVHKAPANEELRWAQDVTIEFTEALHEILNPEGINVIRALPARGLRVYGARTVSSDPAWRYVNVRRLMIMIEEALEEALQWAVFELHDVALREKVAMSIFAFLETLWEQGALAGATAGEAFYIRCNESNNPPDAVADGRLLAEVGVAPVIPAEFIVFRIGRTEDVIETRETEGGA